MAASETDRTEVLRLRREGLSYQEIERRMGWPDTHGNRPWRIVNGTPRGGHPERHEQLASISLWKAHAGGRSFRLIREALAQRGIACERGERSPWEDRYEILMAPENKERALELLFRPVDEWQTQALDHLRDITK